MSLALLFALQAAAAGVAPQSPPKDFDLRNLPSGEAGCGDQGASGSDIVVCGRRRGSGDYPMAEMERRYARKPLIAEIGLGGTVTGRAYVESSEISPGVVSKRAMIGIKTPF